MEEDAPEGLPAWRSSSRLRELLACSPAKVGLMSIVFYDLLSPRAKWVRLGLLERHNRHDRFLNSFHRCQTRSSCLLFPRDWETGGCHSLASLQVHTHARGQIRGASCSGNWARSTITSVGVARVCNRAHFHLAARTSRFGSLQQQHCS